MQRAPGDLAAGTTSAPAVPGRGGRGNPHVAGNPVGGSAAFVGREDVLRTVVRALAEPQNQGIVLYGQRRIGKTSILQHLVATLPERSGHRPVWFDLQDKAAESLDEVLGDLASAIAHALGLPEPAPGPEVESWFRDTWLPKVLDGLPAGVALVLLFDEFDVLADVQAKQAASALFPYLRRLLEKNAPRLRAVFVIGRNIDDLENVAHALFKGQPSCQVSLLARKDAEALVRLGEGNGSITWSAEAVEAAWALTHGHPLLLQALCGHVWVHAHEERQPEDAGRAVTAQDVEEAVEPTLSGSRPAFEWLWKGLPPGKRIVAAALAHAGPEAISEEVLHRVLNENGVRVIIRELREAPRMLIEWDLLEAPAKGVYQFRVELLRRWIERFKPLEQVQQDLDQIEPTAELLYRAAEGLYRAGNLDSAMGRLQEALGVNPNHVRASELLADILISRQDWATARTVLERLYEEQPAVGRARLVQVVLAQAEAAQGEEEQLKLFQRVREAEKNATAIAGIQRIWKARGDQARAQGDLETAGAAYRAGGLAELEAEVVGALREKRLGAALEELRQLEQTEAHAAAFEQISRLANEYGDLRDWSLDVARLKDAARLAAVYSLGVHNLRDGNKERATHLFAEVIASQPDYKKAVSLLHTLVTGVDATALAVELRGETEARVRAESTMSEARSALDTAARDAADLSTQLRSEKEGRAVAEAQVTEARSALDMAIAVRNDTERPVASRSSWPQRLVGVGIGVAAMAVIGLGVGAFWSSVRGGPVENPGLTTGTTMMSTNETSASAAPSAVPIVGPMTTVPVAADGTACAVPPTSQASSPAPTIGATTAAPVVANDDASDVALSRQACNAGHLTDCVNLGARYEMGKGVVKDGVIAYALYNKACDGGNMNGCFSAGTMCYYGGAALDVPRAFTLFNRACDGGNMNGCVRVGEMYEYGLFALKNEALAILFYKKACNEASGLGCSGLNRLRRSK